MFSPNSKEGPPGDFQRAVKYQREGSEEMATRGKYRAPEVFSGEEG
jgi:hypothetical protein